MPRNSRGRYRESDSDSEKFCKLFIGGLSYSTNEESMKEYFEPWGDVVDCVVMRDPNTKKSRGFGFITYKTEEQVDKAQCNRPHNIDNKEVETKRAMPRNETDSQITVKKLFVGGIKEDTTEDDIREFFTCKGKIESIDMITDKGTGKKRGFCFITFEDYDTVDKLVLRKYYEFKGKRIEVKKALSRAEMNHNKQANMNQMSGPMGPMGPGPHMGPMGPMGPGPHMGPPGPHGRGNRGGMGGGRGNHFSETYYCSVQAVVTGTTHLVITATVVTLMEDITKVQVIGEGEVVTLVMVEATDTKVIMVVVMVAMVTNMAMEAVVKVVGIKVVVTKPLEVVMVVVVVTMGAAIGDESEVGLSIRQAYCMQG